MIMETKHTKGEWKIDGNEIISDRTLILELYNDKDFATNPNRKDVNSLPTKENALANAKLIAAAPDLLNALIECRNYIKATADVNGFPPEHLKPYSSAIEAIKKATE